MASFRIVLVAVLLLRSVAASGEPAPAAAPSPPPTPVAAPRFSPAALAPAVQSLLRAESASARFQGATAPVAAKKADSLWNGLLVGAVVGAVAGAVVIRATNPCEGEFCAIEIAAGAVAGTVVGAGVGLLLDAIQ